MMTLCRSCLLYKMSKASLQFWIEKKFQQNSHRKTHSKANKTMKHFQQNHAVAVNPLIYIVCYLNIYLVCYLSNLSQRRYIYCIYLLYILKDFMPLSFAHSNSNSSPAQHSQIVYLLPSPAKQRKTRKKTLLIT